VTHEVGRRHHAALADGVGQVEQAADERAVAGHDLAGERLAVGRRALDHEAALGPDRDDQRVLDHLRLHQPEDLRAEVLAAVRPAQPAAGHGATAQVHALHPRRVDEDLEARARSRQERDAGRVQLERQMRLGPAARPGLEVVRPQDRLDHGEEAAQDPVLVEALDRVDLLLDVRGDRVGRLRAVVAVRVEARVEELDQRHRDGRMGDERLGHVALAERDRRLAQIPGHRPQDRHVAPVEPCTEHEPVEAVVLELVVPHPTKASWKRSRRSSSSTSTFAVGGRAGRRRSRRSTSPRRRVA
jgi:hypothetical protein